MKRTDPTRPLVGERPMPRYVPACATDIRRTWRKARLLAYLRRHTHQASQLPA